jgi:SAM-dependent methyltransferase
MTSDGVSQAKLISEIYGRSASDYREYWAPVLVKAGRELVDPIPMREAAGVLEVAAGVGFLLPHLAAAAPDAGVVGLDITEAMLRLAPDSFPRVVGDVTELPFRDSAFDVVVMSFALFHVLDPRAALAEIARVMGGGGRVAVSTWEASEDDFTAQRIWTEELDRHGAAEAGQRPGSHEQLDTEEKVGLLLTEAGFTDVTTRRRPVVDQPTPEVFLDRRTKLGRDSDRFRSLDPERQSHFLSRMSERLADLGPTDLTSHEVALFCWGSKPTDG